MINHIYKTFAHGNDIVKALEELQPYDMDRRLPAERTSKSQYPEQREWVRHMRFYRNNAPKECRTRLNLILPLRQRRKEIQVNCLNQLNAHNYQEE